MAYNPGVTYRAGEILGQHLVNAASLVQQQREKERQQKEQDKQLKEEVSRYAKMALALGTPAGEVEAMSLGELRGTVDAAALEYTQMRVQQAREAQEHEAQEREAIGVGHEALQRYLRNPGVGVRPDEAYLSAGGTDPKLADWYMQHIKAATEQPFAPSFTPADQLGGPEGGYVFTGQPGRSSFIKAEEPPFTPRVVPTEGLPPHYTVVQTGRGGATVVPNTPRQGAGQELTPVQRANHQAAVAAANSEVRALEVELKALPERGMLQARNDLTTRLSQARAKRDAAIARAKALGIEIDSGEVPTPPPGSGAAPRVNPGSFFDGL